MIEVEHRLRRNAPEWRQGVGTRMPWGTLSHAAVEAYKKGVVQERVEAARQRAIEEIDGAGAGPSSGGVEKSSGGAEGAGSGGGVGGSGRPKRAAAAAASAKISAGASGGGAAAKGGGTQVGLLAHKTRIAGFEHGWDRGRGLSVTWRRAAVCLFRESLAVAVLLFLLE